MPTYEYRCPDCGHKFERFQSITAAPIKECPACHKKKVHRLIGTGAGLIFKGSGFYITDYRSEGYKEKAKAESGTSESKPDDAGSKDNKATPTESKPAAKADTKPATTKEAKAPKKKSA